MRVTPEVECNAFFAHKSDPVIGKTVRLATPLFLALVMVKVIDLVFAVDSVPAIFAILVLRALYFALVAMVHRFKYLKYALALVLVSLYKTSGQPELMAIETK